MGSTLIEDCINVKVSKTTIKCCITIMKPTLIQNDLRVAKGNLQITHGVDYEVGIITLNGKGNVIVGGKWIDELGSHQIGSHNIVIGSTNRFISYGGIVAGKRNTISGVYASVTGGYDNTARRGVQRCYGVGI